MAQAHKLRQWELKCFCGNTDVKTSSNLRSYFNKAVAIKRGEGNSAWRLHCNDHPSHVVPSQIGERLGDLEVVAFPENKGEKLGWSKKERTYRDRWWVGCLCHACGRFSEEKPYLMPMNQWKQQAERRQKNPDAVCSCGCLRNVKHGLATNIGNRRANWAYEIWNAAKQRAKKQGVPFDLDPVEFNEMGIPDVCPVLGIPLDQNPKGKGERSDNSPSLDKFIPSLGYVKGNVHVISWKANRLKNDGTPEEWQKIAEWCQQEEMNYKADQNAPNIEPCNKHPPTIKA